MHPHHAQTIQNITSHLEKDPRVLALLLGGSIAHGYESPTSDVDVMILLSEADYAAQAATGYLTYNNRDCATYDEGYVDGKYITLSFLRAVAERGSEPARYAFDGARILFSRLPDDSSIDLAKEIQLAAAYPLSLKQDRLRRFRAQFAAWHWFVTEARKKPAPGNRYLLTTATSKMVLFAARLILAWNERCYPFHKWVMKEVERVPAGEKPEGVVELMERVLGDPENEEESERLFEMVKTFRVWDATMRPDGWQRWGGQFLEDVEATWLNGGRAVDDL